MILVEGNIIINNFIFYIANQSPLSGKKVACHILILDILIKLLSIVFNIDGNNITLLDYFFYNEITIFLKKILLLFSI